MASEYIEYANTSERQRHKNKHRLAQDARARGHIYRNRARHGGSRDLRPAHELGRLAVQERRGVNSTACPVCGELTDRDDGFCLDCQVYKAGWLAMEHDGDDA